MDRQWILQRLKALDSTRLAKIETFQAKELLLCRVTFSDGSTGFGQCGNKDVDLTCEVVHRRVAPSLLSPANPFSMSENALGMLLPRSLDDYSPLFERVLSFELNYKMMGVQLSKAVAGVDGAIWDCVAKSVGMPIHQLWRGLFFSPHLSNTLDGIPVYASSIAREILPKVLLEKLVDLYSKFGISAFKTKIGERMSGMQSSRVEYDYARMAQQLNEFNSDVQRSIPNAKLSLDANGGFKQAGQVLAICDNNDIWFLEEPLPWIKATIKRPSGVFKTKLAGGEQEFRLDVLQKTISNRVFDIIQPDFGYSGGPSHILMAMREAMILKTVDVFPHSPQGDLHPIMAWHALKARASSSAHLELACIDDGLIQVKLNDIGIFTPVFAKSGGLVIRRGKAFQIDTDVEGWGIEISESFLTAKCEYRVTSSSSLKADSKRSFL